jgi:hypothetical protein
MEMTMMTPDERLKNVLRGEVIQALLQLPSILIEAYVLAASASASASNSQSNDDIGLALNVHAEADPLLFLQHEKTVPQAALKLALYWAKRQACFGGGQGQQQPLVPSMVRALSSQEVATCCMQRLPNDSQGRGVLLIDGSKIAASLTAPGTRCLFYQLHSAMETASLVFLFVAAAASSYDSTTATTKATATTTPLAEVNMFFRLVADLVRSALPVRLSQAIITMSPAVSPAGVSSSSSSNDGRWMIPYVFQAILETGMTDQVAVTLGNTPQEVMHKLSAFDMVQKGLPPMLGGTFLGGGQQQQQQVQVSAGGSNIMASTIPSEQASSSSFSTNKAFLTKRKAVASTGRMPDRSKKAKVAADKKEAAAFMPARKAAPKSGQKKEDSDLKIDEAAATSEGEEELMEPEEDKEKRLRQRNAHYSRRKYERKKIEIQVMKEQAHRLQVENKAFGQEQKRLEKLLAEAQRVVKIHESGGFPLTTIVQHAPLPPPPTALGGAASGPQQNMSTILAAALAAAQAPPPMLTPHTSSSSMMNHPNRELAAFAMLREQEMLNFQAAASSAMAAEASQRAAMNSMVASSFRAQFNHPNKDTTRSSSLYF